MKLRIDGDLETVAVIVSVLRDQGIWVDSRVVPQKGTLNLPDDLPSKSEAEVRNCFADFDTIQIVD